MVDLAFTKITAQERLDYDGLALKQMLDSTLKHLMHDSNMLANGRLISGDATLNILHALQQRIVQYECSRAVSTTLHQLEMTDGREG